MERHLKLGCALFLSLVFVGCGSGQKTTAQGPQVCMTDAPAADDDLKLLPDEIPLTKWGTVTRVDKQKGYVGARAISETTIVELYPQLSKHIRVNGFDTISGENEGFEAEIFFAKDRNTGTFLLREGPCKGQVTIKLLFGAAPVVASPSMVSPQSP